jgi:serine/threonine-protein kinase
MAEVWLAGDSQTKARVALKFLTAETSADPAAKSLLNREWRIGSRLMHASIVRVFEFHDDPEGAYYGLQYVGDTDLSVLAGLRPEESLRPLGLVADALRYAHGKGVVHRDIKASNVLLDSRGHPYLVDFGVAAATGSDPVVGGGSDVSSSPQQMAGESAATSDDIFALGVLMHGRLSPKGWLLPDTRRDRRQPGS